ncbi:hypothetical protein R1sor_015446 [Riccia sorocarpa]|uniref:Uncharacterized protein n=1 Tax=Riccia sorocarpa TaxID=122646 RepID=A0ABD3HEZ2_9MARC
MFAKSMQTKKQKESERNRTNVKPRSSTLLSPRMSVSASPSSTAPANIIVGRGETSRPRRLKQAARARTSSILTTVIIAKTSTTTAKQRRAPPKQMQVSVTIGRIGTNIDPEVFDNMAAFVEANTDMDIIAVERGDSQLQLHIQGMLCLKTSSMLHSGQYIPALRWLVTSALSRERAETLWRAATTPETVTLTDIDHIFFARIPQSRYFEPQHPAQLIEQAAKYAAEQKIPKQEGDYDDEQHDPDDNDIKDDDDQHPAPHEHTAPADDSHTEGNEQAKNQ